MASSVITLILIALVVAIITIAVVYEQNSPSPEVSYNDVSKEAYESIVKQYQPQWFDRSNGWGGQTFLEALSFCASQEFYVLCPYEAYCPEKERGVPLGGIKDENTWAPIMDEPNEWVQVGPRNTCATYSSLTGGVFPEWGLTGEFNEEITRHVMCCLESPSGKAPPGSGPTIGPILVTPESPTMVTPKPPTSDLSGSDVESAIAQSLSPVWFDQTHGWDGGSYEDAVTFCQRLGGLSICPYAAYCPRGPSGAIFGTDDSDSFVEGEQWAPVFGEDNGWIMVGQINEDETTTCQSHEYLEGGDPEWGLDDSRPEIKMHIMCCVLSI